jgi:isopentenyl-diphosphate delta-isomerase
MAMVDLILVDEQNNQIGTMERLLAHKNPGVLHRAISVFLYRKTESSNVEVLIQQRSEHKLLWPLFWANTVCTHPLPSETILHCAVRRLGEEVGITMKEEDLKPLFSFVYQADYSDELSEHECDTVVVGEWLGECQLNPEEAKSVKWISVDALRLDIQQRPDIYAPWPKLIVEHHEFKKWLRSA